MYKQEPGDRYKQVELSFTDSNGADQIILLCVSYENGVRVCVPDIQRIFRDDFTEYLEQVHEENEKEYMYDDTTDPVFEVVPVAVLVDAVYSMQEPDKITLFSWLDAIERCLVRVW